MTKVNFKRIPVGIALLFLLGFIGCEDDIKDLNNQTQAESIDLKIVSSEAQAVINQLKIDAPDAIIAHRGSTFWAPEETEAAFRWARNMGADYLEIDIQKIISWRR